MRREFLALELELRVQGRKLLPELLDGAVVELLRNEEIGLYVLLIDFVAGLTAEDYEFAYHIPSGKVNPRVRLGEAQFTGLTYGLAQRHIFG